MISGGRADGFRQKSLAQKTEEMRAQKVAYETARARMDKILVVARALDRDAFAFTEKEEGITKAIRRPAWDEAERLVTSVEEATLALLAQKLEERCRELRKRLEELPHYGLGATPEQSGRLEALTRARAEARWEDALTESRALGEELDQTEGSAIGSLAEQIGRVITWGVPEPSDEVMKIFDPCRELIEKKELAKATVCAEETLAKSVPQVRAKLTTLTTDLTGLLPIGKKLGIETVEAEKILERTKDPRLLTADRLGKELERTVASLGALEKEEITRRITHFKVIFERTLASGGEPGEGLHELEAVALEIEKLTPLEAISRLGHAEGLIETPVLHVVFERLEEARSYMEEARELGRNVDAAVEGISRVRKAIHEKDFERALETSTEALDRARNLVEDVEVVRNELEEYKNLLTRLSSGGLQANVFEGFVQRTEEAIASRDFSAARAALREGIRSVGKESSTALREQLSNDEQALELLGERHWAYPEELSSRTEEANLLLSSGRVGEAAEVISDVSSQIQVAVVGPYTNRLDELDANLNTLADEEVRKYARSVVEGARAKLSTGTGGLALLEMLTQVEREVSVTFATEVGRLVADLDDNLLRLGKMGMPTEGLARGIAQVREILDLGDFLRAVKTGQDVTDRMRQAALAKADEALSEAKLAFVEVSKTVPEPTTVKDLLDAARLALQNGNYLEAVETATRAKETASEIRATAQKIVDRISHVVNQMTALRKRGTSPEDLRVLTSKIADVRTAYQSLAFDTANGTIDEIAVLVDGISTKLDIKTTLESVSGTIGGTEMMGLPETDWADKVVKILEAMGNPEIQILKSTTDDLTREVLERVVPVLNEQVKILENELQLARQQGLETQGADALLSTVKVQLGEKFPIGVAKTIGQIKSQFFQSRAFQETAHRALAEAREYVNQAEFLQLDVTQLTPRISQVEETLRRADYGGVLEASHTIKDEAAEAVKSHLNLVLSNLRGMITRSKREGALTMVAENYLSKARGLVGTAPPREILQLVTLAENELERSELQYSIAQSSVQMLVAKIAEAEKEVLIVLGAQAELTKAQQAFETGDYPLVLDVVMVANDLIQQASLLRGKAQETYRKASRVVGAAKIAGIDVVEAESEVGKYEASCSKGQYPEADAAAHAAYERARTAFGARLTRDIEELRPVLDVLTGDDLALASLKNGSEEVRLARAKEEWERAVQVAAETRKEATTKVTGLLSAERARTAQVESLLPPDEVASIEKKFSEGKRALEAQDFKAGTEALVQVREEVGSVLSAYVSRGTEYLLKGSRTVEWLGLDGSPVIESLSEVKTLLRQPTPDAAIEKVTESMQKLDRLLLPALTERLDGAGRQILMARESLNVAVNTLEDRVKAAKELKEKGDLLSSTEGILSVLVELTHRKAMQKELVTAHYLIDTLIGQATDAKKSVKHPSELLEQSIGYKAVGDYEKAISTANEAVKELKESLA